MIQSDTVLFSAASTTGPSSLEYLIWTTDLNSINISNSRGQEDGSVSFSQSGFLSFESRTNLENDRFVINCKLGPHSEGVVPLLMIKLLGVFPNTYVAFVSLDSATGIYTHETPFAEFSDTTLIEIQAVDPISRDPFLEGFSVISCSYTRIRNPIVVVKT